MKIKLEQADLEEMARLWVADNFVNKRLKELASEGDVEVEVEQDEHTDFEKPDLGTIQRGGPLA